MPLLPCTDETPMRSSLIAVVIALLSLPAHARDIFVDNIAGDDRANGDLPRATTNHNGPVRTISKALKLTQGGDRILLAKTTIPYHECVSIQGERHSGRLGKPLVLEGNGAVLDGSEPVPPDAWQFVSGDVFRFEPARMSYQQLFLDGKPVTRRFVADDVSFPELLPFEWCLLDGTIYFRGAPGSIPQEYLLTYAALQTGITLYKVHDVVIHNLVVQGFHLDGVNAHDGVRSGRLINIMSRGNGRAGVCIAGGSRVELAGCTLGDNGAAQLLLEEYSLTRVFDSLLIPNTAPEFVRSPESRLYLDGKLTEAKDGN
jgi:hypothetical protein